MAFDLNKLKKGAQKSAENLRQSVSGAAEKLPDSVKENKVADSVKGFAQKGQGVFSALKAKSEETMAQKRDKTALQKEAVADALQLQGEQEIVLSVKDSLRIIYCLMIIDGKVSEEETARFCEIGRELDPEFEAYQNALVDEGTGLMNMPSEDEDGYYDNIHDFVSQIIHTGSRQNNSGIRGKTLIWDLLAVAYSEGEYSASEKRLLRFITKSLGVDSAVLLEMEHTVRTLLAIEAEEKWLKDTDRPYTTVEERVNELTERKNTIMMGVHALLAD